MPAQAARRALKNRALYYLGELGDAKVTADLLRRTREATNMTDHIAALAALVDHPGAPPNACACFHTTSNSVTAGCSVTDEWAQDCYNTRLLQHYVVRCTDWGNHKS